MASVQTITIAAAAGIAGLVLLRYSGAVKGALTGDNALTRGATNAAGEAVTAYQGAGPVGTLGAAANAASGGYLATLGQWLGSSAYDLLNSGPAEPEPARLVKPAGQLVDYTLPVSRDTSFAEASAEGYDWRGYGWGVVEP